jgi:hypothetical protein
LGRNNKCGNADFRSTFSGHAVISKDACWIGVSFAMLVLVDLKINPAFYTFGHWKRPLYFTRWKRRPTFKSHRCAFRSGLNKDRLHLSCVSVELSDTFG